MGDIQVLVQVLQSQSNLGDHVKHLLFRYGFGSFG